MKRPLTQHRCNGRRCAVCQPVVTRELVARLAAIVGPGTVVRTPAWRIPKPRGPVC